MYFYIVHSHFALSDNACTAVELIVIIGAVEKIIVPDKFVPIQRFFAVYGKVAFAGDSKVGIFSNTGSIKEIKSAEDVDVFNGSIEWLDRLEVAPSFAKSICCHAHGGNVEGGVAVAGPKSGIFSRSYCKTTDFSKFMRVLKCRVVYLFNRCGNADFGQMS